MALNLLLATFTSSIIASIVHNEFNLNFVINGHYIGRIWDVMLNYWYYMIFWDAKNSVQSLRWIVYMQFKCPKIHRSIHSEKNYTRNDIIYNVFWMNRPMNCGAFKLHINHSSQWLNWFFSISEYHYCSIKFLYHLISTIVHSNRMILHSYFCKKRTVSHNFWHCLYDICLIRNQCQIR